MDRFDKKEALLRFVQDAFIDGFVGLARLEPEHTEQLVEVSEKFNLDFDDAYQYLCALKYGLTLISFDSDFDRTDLQRKTPDQVP